VRINNKASTTNKPQLPHLHAYCNLKTNFIIKKISIFFNYSTKKFNFAAEQSNYTRMATKEDIQRFLNQMKEKIKVFGII